MLPLFRAAIGSELAVRYVLEGNIRRSPEGIELNVQLSDAARATSMVDRPEGGPVSRLVQLARLFITGLTTRGS